MPAIDRSLPETRENFTKIFPEVPNPNSRTVGGTPSQVSDEIRQCRDMWLDINKRLRMQGLMPITIVNFNPFPLQPDGTIFHGVIIPGVPDEDEIDAFKPTKEISVEFAGVKHDVPYVRYSFRQVLFSIADKGGAMFVPREHVPVQIAAEINRQFYDIGGVMAYYNDVPPDDARAILRADELNFDDDPTHEVVVKRFGEIQTVMLRKMLRLVQEAETKYNQPNRKDFRDVNEQHRRAARYLLKRGRLPKNPPWLVKEVDPEAAPLTQECPICKTRSANDAVRCNCGYFFDVLKGYTAGLIEDSDHKTLRRLNMEELESQGLDPKISMEYRKLQAQKKKGKVTAEISE